jgi:hypothetical protein
MTVSRKLSFIAAIASVVLIAFFLLSVNEESAPWEGCRASSKTEYESAKQNFLLQTSFGAYARTGHWWRRYYWYCHV